MLTIDEVFEDLMIFIDELVKDNTEPIKPSPQHIENLKQDIINNPINNNPHLQKNFFLMERVAGEILFSYNVDKFLGLKEGFDLKDFLACIQDGKTDYAYLQEYLTWAKAAYTFIQKLLKTDINPDDIAFKIRMPMRISDGKYYWVMQESRFLEMDKNNNLLSHINTYTISNHYNEKQPVGLQAELHFNHSFNEEWSRIIAESKFNIKPFVITPHQKDILVFFYKNPNKTIKDCAASLGHSYSVNTVKKYISDSRSKRGILDIAKNSFPAIPIKTLKDVINILHRIGWFTND